MSLKIAVSVIRSRPRDASHSNRFQKRFFVAFKDQQSLAAMPQPNCNGFHGLMSNAIIARLNDFGIEHLGLARWEANSARDPGDYCCDPAAPRK